ncbi:MAG: hypothetical protein HPY44_02985 [Armatimonadetes bacterium]|nr:hypothetical protein [Armatimonadota bacterium]
MAQGARHVKRGFTPGRHAPHKSDSPGWRLGKDDISVVYSCTGQIAEPPMSIAWLDVILDYTP